MIDLIDYIANRDKQRASNEIKSMCIVHSGRDTVLSVPKWPLFSLLLRALLNLRVESLVPLLEIQYVT